MPTHLTNMLKTKDIITSMHYPLGVHVIKSRTQLHKVLPYSPLRYQTLLFTEVTNHTRQISGISQLKHDIKFIVFDEGCKVLDDVGMIQFLKKNIYVFTLFLKS